MIDLILFYTDINLVRRASGSGVNRIVIDLERKNKHIRQNGHDTQINTHTVTDIETVKRETNAFVICRINHFGNWTKREIGQAIQHGADEILLPMVRSTAEVDRVLEYVGDRCQTGILIETVDAVDIADVLDSYTFSRIYVGLNDLYIDRKAPHLFVSLMDGTVDRIRKQIKNTPFGFGGLTVPEKGTPLPCCHLINEMSRLNCQFTFLRRSFIRDSRGCAVDAELHKIFEAVREAGTRSLEQVEDDHAEAIAAMKALPPL